MRTILDIDDDVLDAAMAIAARDRRPLGKIISELARRSLVRSGRWAATRNGVPLLLPHPDAETVTLSAVNALQD